MALLGLIALVYIIFKLIQEAAEPTIPGSFYNNQELYRKDTMDPNISAEELKRNVRNGKYI